MNYIQKNGVIQFFSLFNLKLQTELPQISDIIAIECREIDRDFNRRFQYHGPPNNGAVGFVFHVKYKNGTSGIKHYCLGHGCERGCKEDYFKI